MTSYSSAADGLRKLDSTEDSQLFGSALLSLHVDDACLWQARFLEAVREFGRDPKLISKRMGNRTIGACKKFYSKNRERLQLDALTEEHRNRRRAEEAAKATAAGASAGAAGMAGVLSPGEGLIDNCFVRNLICVDV